MGADRGRRLECLAHQCGDRASSIGARVVACIEARIESRVVACIEAGIEARVVACIEARIESRVVACIETRVVACIETGIVTRIEAGIMARVEARIEARIVACIDPGVVACIEARVESCIGARIESGVGARIESGVGTRVRSRVDAPINPSVGGSVRHGSVEARVRRVARVRARSVEPCVHRGGGIDPDPAIGSRIVGGHLRGAADQEDRRHHPNESKGRRLSLRYGVHSRCPRKSHPISSDLISRPPQSESATNTERNGYRAKTNDYDALRQRLLTAGPQPHATPFATPSCTIPRPLYTSRAGRYMNEVGSVRIDWEAEWLEQLTMRPGLRFPSIETLASSKSRVVTVFDLETTHFEVERDNFGITEIGMVHVFPDGRVATVAAMVNPQSALRGVVVAKTGISRDAVRNAPTWGEVWARLIEPIASEHITVGFRSTSFDIPAAATQTLRYHPNTRLSFAFHLDLAWLDPFASGSLEQLTKVHGLPEYEAHRALPDAIACSRLLERYLQTSGDLPLRRIDATANPDRTTAEEHMPETPNVDHLLEGEGGLKQDSIAQAVDRLAELRETRRQLDDQIDRLQAAIADYAKASARDVLEGTAFKAKVSWTQSRSLPPANSDERRRLEEVVRRAGLWEDSSNLSAPKILKAIKASAVGSDDRATVEGLIVLTDSSRLTLSRIKR